MIKSINKKYCINDLVQLMTYTSSFHLIMSTDEIILLKNREDVIINKYQNHPSRYLFPYSDQEKFSSEYTTNYNELFEYDKVYLNFRGAPNNFSFHINYFFKGNDRALYLNESLDVNLRNALEIEEFFTRKELERKLDPNEFDAMYLIEKTGNILYAKNPIDGDLLCPNIVPTDDELLNNSKIFHESFGTTLLEDGRTIDELRNITIYGSKYSKYNHLLITVKDGEFSVKWFKLDFVSKDIFRVTTSPIPVLKPTVDDIIKYTDTHTIEETKEPHFDETYEMEEVIKRIRIPKAKLREIDLYE